MLRSLPKRHWSYPLIALLAGAVMIARVVGSTCVYNNTVDEPYHIGSAIVLWEAKQLTVGAQHPPLARWVIGLPLVMEGMSYPEARGEYVVTEFPGFGIGQDLLFSGKLPYWRILATARRSMLVFSVLALFYLYRLGRYLAGSLAAMLATVFFSLDPTFLAHSGLVGTDIAGCAGFLAGIYYLVRFCARPNWPRATIAGLATGLAISCKFSSLLLIPIIVVILLARWIVWKKSPPGPRRLFVACAIAFFTLWATYGLAINPMRQQAMLVHEPAWTGIPEVIREQPIPMPSFFLGQILLASRAMTGHTTYLNGRLAFDGFLAYFPEALAVKEPVGFGLLLLIGMVLFLRRPRSQRTWLLLMPIVIYFAISMRSRYQLGIRHLLPILPLMYLFGVMQLSRNRCKAAVLVLLAMTAVETAVIHPDYLAFFNFASGGPRHGERYLIDSNLDWGQDLNRLAEWLKSPQARGRPYSIRCAFAPPRLVRQLGMKPEALTRPPTSGLLAISKNVEHRLDATYSEEGRLVLGEDYSWVSRYPLVKRIGYSIDVYDLDAKDSPTQ